MSVLADRDPFVRQLRAEWTKLRSVRSRLVTLIATALALALFSVLSAAGERRTCSGESGCAALVLGPDGRPVVDSYELAGRTLAGDGGVTVRVASLTGLIPPPGRVLGRTGPPGVPLSEGRPGLEPWAKAGLIITASTRPGASYAAIMITAEHGVRFQYDYVHDVAGPSGEGTSGRFVPLWLRLTRVGDLVTGYASPDGAAWTRVGSARLSGLPEAVQAGPFVASPQHADLTEHPFVTSGAVGPALATAEFAGLALAGAASAPSSSEAWTGQTVGGPDDGYPALAGSVTRQGDDGLRISGSGDLAPAVGGVQGSLVTVDHALAGGFVALIMVIALGAVSAASEYRRGLILATFAATPRRGRVLAAKALVVGAATFLLTAPAAALSVVVGQNVLRANHNLLYPVTANTEVRVVLGTAGFLTVAAITAVALGIIVRRSTAAITIVVVAFVLPYVLFQALPAEASEWLLRVAPTAALAVQQTLPVYRQVAIGYTPVEGYYPLGPLAGFLVACAYCTAALGVAFFLLRRRDS